MLFAELIISVELTKKPESDARVCSINDSGLFNNGGSLLWQDSYVIKFDIRQNCRGRICEAMTIAHIGINFTLT